MSTKSDNIGDTKVIELRSPNPDGEEQAQRRICACHLSMQARVNPDTPLLTMPSDWARPYIAGFYEAGFGTPGPSYDLQAWIDKYEAGGNEWAEWAPEPSGGDA